MPLNSEDPEQERLTQKALKLMQMENARVCKWKEMLEEYPEKKDPKLKSRARKGIPDAIRGYAWQILIQGSTYLDSGSTGGRVTGDGKDKAAIFKALMEENADQKLIISIFKDISRTLPQHIFFKDRFGVGQKALFCVLKALALHEQETGYVQGMGYMAAILLTYMDMEDAFACLVGILRGFSMRDMFMPGMPGLSKAFYIHLSLMKKYLPKLLQHLKDLNFLPQTYGSQWFMTIFAVNMPFACIVRIWDIFMVEGRKIMYRVALAIFKLNEKALLKCEMEGVFELLREFQKDIDPELLIKTALSFKFPGQLIDKIEKEFTEKPDKELAKICKME